MKKIAMFTMGTRGDVQPYIYLAQELNKKGYDTLLGSHPCWKQLIESSNVKFVPVGPDIDIEKEAAVIRGKNKNPMLDYAVDASPEQWLYIINHARYVFTNSFHGTVLSLQFQKQFYSYASGEKAYRREIRIGRQNPQYYEVIEGLQPGEKVITSSYDNFGENEVLILNK